MKKNILYSFFALIICSFCASGCLYEQGPFFSFNSATFRAAYIWKFSKVTLNNANVTLANNPDSINYSASTLGLDKDGRFTFIANSLRKKDKGDVVYLGNWWFANGERDLVLKHDNDAFPLRAFRIIKLTETDFRYKYVDSKGNNTTFLLTPVKK
jgi:hypothetical protein